ncbi:hypothetical protein ACZ87_03446 [Candidatus Erwinia dacicola]|uniref:Transposase n=1 Tax=Candidatus Erwinia dacicola TaxID=252393 RepID=A0A328TK18_9GAMM|nr:hypothetical protein ACZ87_03446 [Candidatus Erwinia dacicola]
MRDEHFSQQNKYIWSIKTGLRAVRFGLSVLQALTRQHGAN